MTPARIITLWTLFSLVTFAVVAAVAQSFQTGRGIVMTSKSGQLPVISVDDAYVTMRTGPAPLKPAACPASVGTAVWATDTKYLYVCVPDGSAPNTGFQWARTPLATAW